jgi:hypothetical protein
MRRLSFYPPKDLIMKPIVRFLLVIILLAFLTTGRAQKTYTLISKKTEKINKAVVTSLPPYLKALAAFYSAMGGTNCLDLECDLTLALGLGKQGSDAQKKLIEKYFPDDKAAQLILGQDCYLPPGSSSSFSNFSALSFMVNGENVQVNYLLHVYDHGNMKVLQGPDIYIFKNEVFKNKKRVLYAWTSK